MLEILARLRSHLIVGLVIIGSLVCAGGVYEDYRSCQRQVPVRESSRVRVGQLKAAWSADAARADAYAIIDPNPRGRAVNVRFARGRRALVRSLKPVAPIDCGSFPPGL